MRPVWDTWEDPPFNVFYFDVLGCSAFIRVCTPHVQLAPLGGQKRVLVPSSLELEMVMSCYVGDGNGAQGERNLILKTQSKYRILLDLVFDS